MINIPKGTKDVLPNDSYKWQYIENKAKDIAALFNLKEVRTPAFEHTELFLRGVGDTTDIVSKEMYTFTDKGGRSITLKPEGTAGVARSFIENSLSGGVMPVKMFYFTPVFRYERPQAGRLRQHHQFGVEVFGAPGADTDAEVILCASQFFDSLNIQNIQLNINSIGCPECRPDYNAALKKYLTPHIENMCQTCRTRLDKNPLRILDCKEEACRRINQNAPKITDSLCGGCFAHFENLKDCLNAANLSFVVNPYIVRGLDYYSKTVFEFVSYNIGSQGTVCGGGRYDGLVEGLGGAKTPCVGFGLGLERLLLLMENTGIKIPEPDGVMLYIAGLDESSRKKAFETAAQLRRLGISAETDHMQRGIKPQLRYADKIGAKYLAVIGENELVSGVVNLKRMSDGSVAAVEIDKITEFLKEND